MHAILCDAIRQAIFGMNVTEINTGSVVNLARYFELAVPLTAVTVWVVVSLQSKARLGDPEATMWSQMWWPFIAVMDLFRPLMRGRRGDRGTHKYARV
jgi:hypothetical protein